MQGSNDFSSYPTCLFQIAKCRSFTGELALLPEIFAFEVGRIRAFFHIPPVHQEGHVFSSLSMSISLSCFSFPAHNTWCVLMPRFCCRQRLRHASQLWQTPTRTRKPGRRPIRQRQRCWPGKWRHYLHKEFWWGSKSTCDTKCSYLRSEAEKRWPVYGGCSSINERETGYESVA